MAKSGKSKAKATKTFLKKGLLDGQIKVSVVPSLPPASS